MEFVECFFKEDTEPIILNHSQTRSLQICLDSIEPELKLFIRFTAHDHKCHVNFTFQSWHKVLEKSQEIIRKIRAQKEDIIFINDQLKIFTERRHGKYAVCFMDSSTQRVNILAETFDKMLKVSGQVTERYLKYYKKIKTTAQELESFVEWIIQQNQSNVPHNDIPLVDTLHQLKNLPNLSTESLKIPDFNGYYSENSDDMDEDEDDEDSFNNCNESCPKCCDSYY